MDAFFKQPILNSPYEYPNKHWELDDTGQPTQQIIKTRRSADTYFAAVPKPKKQKGSNQETILLEDAEGLSTQDQRYETSARINEVRQAVDDWRSEPDPANWHVTPETARLLQHWRHHAFSDIRPFFCQIEAVETTIWLTEVAPKNKKAYGHLLRHLENANQEANPLLSRLALKLATGAGKTTVMAMLIAWQTVNAVRHPGSKHFTRGFLITTPGLTIRDRLRVLKPNDPDSYYASRELVPPDLMPELEKAKIVITNYHAFKLREHMDVSAGGRALLQGRQGEAIDTKETTGQMLQRVCPDLMGMQNIIAINDEAHHCYREKPSTDNDGNLKGEAKEEAEKNNEAARLWISGLEAIADKMGLTRVMDLSATPFFLRGSGYAEGTLFPWTMSDFSLMDAIECGIVKLPRVPVADNIPSGEMPMFRNLWEHIRTEMPKKGRGKAASLDPSKLPVKLENALDALYGHYAKTFKLWQEAGIESPPCFIIVCNNTATSKLVYDYISGYVRKNNDGTDGEVIKGKLELFRNYNEHGDPLPRPHTFLIDSTQLESGEALDKDFRDKARDEIERFRRELIERGEHSKAEKLTDQDLLREVMNTVGKKDRLGGKIRCVVSVSMLTEGWDTNTVTHVLGIRAFGTQLLCEQVIGRALRRESYELNEQGLFNVEYADVLGIPFNFTAKPVVAPPQKPRETVQVKAIRPERNNYEIRFPRVSGYRVELPDDRLTATFTEDHHYTLTPETVGATKTQNSGIIGEFVNLDLGHHQDARLSTIVMTLTQHLMMTKWPDPDGAPQLHLFGQLKRIAKQWLNECLHCKGGTYPAQLMYRELLDEACERITSAIVRTEHSQNKRPIHAVLDAYNPEGSTAQVSFSTSKTTRWQTRADRCHINWVIYDSDWEAECCRVIEQHPQVIAYVKNHSLGFEVPYQHNGIPRRYRPDFIVLINDGHGPDDPLHLVVEIKGYRGENAKDKANTMKDYWVPGVNALGSHGRWAFAEFTKVFEIEGEFGKVVEDAFATLVTDAAPSTHWRQISTNTSANLITNVELATEEEILRRTYGTQAPQLRAHAQINDLIERDGSFTLTSMASVCQQADCQPEHVFNVLALLTSPQSNRLALSFRQHGQRVPLERIKTLLRHMESMTEADIHHFPEAQAIQVSWTTNSKSKLVS